MSFALDAAPHPRIWPSHERASHPHADNRAARERRERRDGGKDA